MKSQNKASSFICRLRSILKSRNFHEIIRFDEEKGKIYIFDKEKLQNQILPFYFRHKKLSSFVRQLNLYGFKKIKNISTMCFTHPALVMGQKLESIVSQKKLRELEESQQGSLEHQVKCEENSQGSEDQGQRNRQNQQRETVPSQQKIKGSIERPEGYPLLGQPLSYAQDWRLFANPPMGYFMPVPQMFPGFPFLHFQPSFRPQQ